MESCDPTGLASICTAGINTARPAAVLARPGHAKTLQADYHRTLLPSSPCLLKTRKCALVTAPLRSRGRRTWPVGSPACPAPRPGSRTERAPCRTRSRPGCPGPPRPAPTASASRTRAQRMRRHFRVRHHPHPTAAVRAPVPSRAPAPHHPAGASDALRATAARATPD